MQVRLYNGDIQALNEKDPLCLNWSRIIKSRALVIHCIHSLSGRISKPLSMSKVGVTLKLSGVTLKMSVPVTGHLSQGELNRSQFCLDNGRIHSLRPSMNKEAAVGIEMSGLGKLDCNTNKSFAYWGGGSFQGSWPPWCFLLLSAPLPAVILETQIGSRVLQTGHRTVRISHCNLKTLHCYWWAMNKNIKDADLLGLFFFLLGRKSAPLSEWIAWVSRHRAFYRCQAFPNNDSASKQLC